MPRHRVLYQKTSNPVNLVLEERGVPSVVICTEVFFAAGKVQARVLGYNELEPLTFAHPIQSLTQDQIPGTC